jgi:hypothetical protein
MKRQVIVDKHCPVIDDLTRKVQVGFGLKKNVKSMCNKQGLNLGQLYKS